MNRFGMKVMFLVFVPSVCVQRILTVLLPTDLCSMFLSMLYTTVPYPAHCCARHNKLKLAVCHLSDLY